MRRLLLLRHAKSDPAAPGQRDKDRPLNARGREAAALIGGYLERHRLAPDRALASTAVRTRETWILLAQALARPVSAEFDERLYSAPPDAILDVIRAAPPAALALIVIGHNPGLQALAAALAGTGDSEMRQRMAEKFPTTALAVIDFAIDDWAALRPGGGRLVHFIDPRALDAAAD